MKFKIYNPLDEERYALRKSERIENYYTPELQSLLKEIASEQKRGYEGFSRRYEGVRLVRGSDPKIYVVLGVKFAPKTSTEEGRSDGVIKLDSDDVGTDLLIRCKPFESEEEYKAWDNSVWGLVTVSMRYLVKGILDVKNPPDDDYYLVRDTRVTEEFNKLVALYKDSVATVEQENQKRLMTPEERKYNNASKNTVAEVDKYWDTPFPGMSDSDCVEWCKEHIVEITVEANNEGNRDALENLFKNADYNFKIQGNGTRWSWESWVVFDEIDSCPNKDLVDCFYHPGKYDEDEKKFRKNDSPVYKNGKPTIYSNRLVTTLYQVGFCFGPHPRFRG